MALLMMRCAIMTHAYQIRSPSEREGEKEGKICKGCQMLPLQICASAPLPR